MKNKLIRIILMAFVIVSFGTIAFATDITIDDIFSNSDKFFKLIFGNDNYIHFSKDDKSNIVFFILPNNYGSKIKLYLADEIIRDYRPSYNIPPNRLFCTLFKSY